MKKIGILIVIMIVVSCSEQVRSDDLHHLNGYWEIETVTFADGNTKNYNVNTMVDYIELDGLKGFKKKAQPKFDGTYTVNDDAESFTIMESEGIFTIQYRNKMSQWEEEITRVSKTHFSVVNQDGITYVYKRYQPINVQN